VQDWEAPNPVKDNRSGLIGKGVDRYEGPLKVSGTAAYAYEVQPPSPPAYGVMVGAEIATGRISDVDIAAAEAAPGVLAVWTHRNVPAQPPRGTKAHPRSTQGSKPALESDRVTYFGQPVAFVVADTLENATAAAKLVRLTYAADDPVVDFAARLADAGMPPGEQDTEIGDFEAGFAASEVKLDETWTTPIQNHCQMEPCASIVWWEGGKCVAHTSIQMVKPAQHGLAETLGIGRDDVHLMTRYIGGGFGGKGQTYDDLTLAALAARALGRPVKVAFTRQQMMHGTIHRPATVQRVRLGASADGRLNAMSLMTWTHCQRDGAFTEHASNFARSLYAAPNRLTGHRLVKLDLPHAGPMRAPGEASGTMSLECAMDELAEKLGMDPVELRIRNEPEVDPENGRPFSMRQLVRCMREGAQLFGWDRRLPAPGQVRDGRWRVGLGMAAAIRGNFLLPAKCSFTVDAEGVITVRQGMTDIGTGTYTVLAQIAAETLGVPLGKVVVEIGDSELPPAPGSGGGTPSSQFYAEQWSGCLPATVFPMSNQWQTLKDQITAMVPSGNTNQAIGLAWGWQSLSTTNPPISAPSKASNYVYKDYIVLLSDGLNTQNRWSTSQSSIDARQAILCQNIKADTANPVTIFTIQVNINNADAKSQVLQDCATNGNFQMITSASQTSDAFKNILTQISKLRVAR